MIFDRLKLLLIALLLAGGCQPPKQPGYVTLKGAAMGTSWSVQLEIRGERGEAEDVRSRISHALEMVEQLMSTWRENSRLSQFNNSLSTRWEMTHPLILKVLRQAQEVSRATDGAFDVTVQPLVNLWGFGAASAITNAPSADQLDAARAVTGYQKIKLGDQLDEWRKLNTRTQIDLSALAKGFAVDFVSEYLDELNYTNHLVEIGGELRGRGRSAKGRPWRVGLELPLVGESQISDAVELPNDALATSGDYRNYLDLDGKRYAHIIDPRTGYPIEQQRIAVSVLAKSCMKADAWATALTVLGLEEGMKVAETNQIAAHFRIYQGEELIKRFTTQWPKTH